MAYKPTRKEVKQSLDALAFMSGEMTSEQYFAAQPKTRKQTTYPEADAQMAVIAWCRMMGYPYDRLYAIENERKAISPQQAARRKKMGVRAGVSDLCMDVARNGYHGLKIEMKAPKGIVSDRQQEYIDEVRAEGYAAYVCYSADEAIKVLQDYCK